MNKEKNYDSFEQFVRKNLSETTKYECVKQFEVGRSGNKWKVDCVLLNSHSLRKGYIEVKNTSRSSNRSTYINHMRRAYAEMGDFSHMEIPKAVVLAEKWNFGRIDWDAMFDSIGCMLLDIDDLDQFISVVDEDTVQSH